MRTVNNLRTSNYSLIELIAVIILSGFLVVTIGLFLIPMVDALEFNRSSAENTQQAQLVIARISKEIRHYNASPSIEDDGISMRFNDSGSGISSINWLDTVEGSPLVVNNDPDSILINNVSDFSIREISPNLFEISIKLEFNPEKSFTVRTATRR